MVSVVFWQNNASKTFDEVAVGTTWKGEVLGSGVFAMPAGDAEQANVAEIPYKCQNPMFEVGVAVVGNDDFADSTKLDCNGEDHELQVLVTEQALTVEPYDGRVPPQPEESSQPDGNETQGQEEPEDSGPREGLISLARWGNGAQMELQGTLRTFWNESEFDNVSWAMDRGGPVGP